MVSLTFIEMAKKITVAMDKVMSRMCLHVDVMVQLFSNKS